MQQGKNALSLVKQKWAKFEIVCAKILNTIQPHTPMIMMALVHKQSCRLNVPESDIPRNSPFFFFEIGEIN